ncbi:meiotic recombination [Tilletia horrida]|nr:meiotic recombination [Tilletia horrida]
MSRSPSPEGSDVEITASFEGAENDPDCVRFLLASDNHIGFMEKDPVRGQDSINTFKEIMKLAVERDVDFILLGGDLFHDNKPSRLTLHQTIALLREHTMGDKPISVELRSDAGKGYKEGYTFPSVNYADENINIGIPVFSIHGNHDDPQGSGAGGSLSALDILSAAGLITYFGRTDLPSDDASAAAPANRASAPDEADPGIRLRPILLQKGNTKLALYGLGNIRDERLHFELRANRVRLQRPAEETDEWFNLLVLHQNRARHNLKAAVPEGLFDDSTHLVIWGHEHECRIAPETVTGKRYKISQPGSSVATSLSPGETEEKKVAIVTVKGRAYHMEPIKLKTVRPFIMDEIDLEKELEKLNIKGEDKDRITKFLRGKVNDLVKNAVASWEEEHADDDPKPERMLPLIRLRVIYTNQVVGNPVRFGQEFAGKVANPKEVLQFHKKKESSKKVDPEDEFVNVTDRDIVAAERLERVQISSLMKQILMLQNMQLLNPKEVQDAVAKYAEKDNKDALTDSLQTFITHTVAMLKDVANEEELDRRLESMRYRPGDASGEGADDEGAEEGDEPAAAGPSKSAAAKKARGRSERAASDDSMLQDMDVDEEEAAPAATSRKGKGKTGSASPKKPAAKKTTSRSARAAAEEDDEDDDDIVEQEPPAKKGRASTLSQLGGKKAGPSRAAATKKAPAKKKASAASSSSSAGMRQSQLDFSAAPTRGRAAAKKAQARISYAAHDDDDDDEEEEEDAIEDGDEEDDDDDDGEAYRPPQNAGGPGKGLSEVIEIGDSDDEDDDDDVPRPPAKKRATAARRR